MSEAVGDVPESFVCKWEGETWSVEQAQAWVEINNTFYRLGLQSERQKGDTGISQVVRALEKYAEIRSQPSGSR